MLILRQQQPEINSFREKTFWRKHELLADPDKSVRVLTIIFGKIVIAASHVSLVASSKLQHGRKPSSSGFHFGALKP